MSTNKEEVRLAKWGNSRAARIPSSVIKQLNLVDGQKLVVTIENNAIVLTPEKKQPADIHDLFADWQDDGLRDQQMDWGKAMGHEMPW